MANLFISYRRADTEQIAGRIDEWLERRFPQGSVFFDIESIPQGADFRECLVETMRDSHLMLALIGSEWLEKDLFGSSRILSPKDFVRMEIESALSEQIAVIPVLIGRARMPYEAELPPSLSRFAYLEAAVVDPGRDFNVHMERLIGNIERRLWAILRQEDLERRLNEISNQPRPNADGFIERSLGISPKDNALSNYDREFQSALWEGQKLKSQYALLRDELFSFHNLAADVPEELVRCYRARVFEEMERVSAHREAIRQQVMDLGAHENTLRLFD